MPQLTTGTFFSPAICICQTLALLAAVDIHLANNNVALVIGNAAAFDGSSWLYVYDADFSTADNGSTIIKPTSVLAADPGRWRRVVTTA